MKQNLFNIKKFDLQLETEILGRNFIFLKEVESTNTYLKEIASESTIEGTVVFAEKQTDGKGRLDRIWYSEKGSNLTFSFFLKGKFLKKNLNFINLGTALAIANSIENLYQLKTELKWPNDILVNGKKLSGILLESISEGEKLKFLVVGIGVNVNQTNFAGTFNIPPTSVKLENNNEVEREKLLAEILNNLENILDSINSNHDYILKEWRLRCGMIGEKISISQGDNTKYGVFDDIDDDGFLLLKTEKRIEKIHFGDLSLF
jgi:BirA family biotin operon repressor/biotin-[acetyl-CoA-carboxylase] ligase